MENIDTFFNIIAKIGLCSSCNLGNSNYNSQIFKNVSSTLTNEGYTLDNLMSEVSVFLFFIFSYLKAKNI